MQLVPEWAPNVHPMFVHFPIALLFTAVLVDLLALVVRPWRWLRPAAVTVYVLGAISAVVTWFTGRAAADSVMLPAQAQSVLTDHANLATWTVWFFGIYALVRLGSILYERTRGSVAVHFVLFLVGLGGLYLPWQTAEHGSMMVYRYGVAVQAAEIENPVQHDHSEHEHASGNAPSGDDGGTGLVVAENGSWQWTPSEGAAQSLAASFMWFAGEAAALDPETVSDGETDTALALHPEGESVMFVVDESLASVQADAEFNLSGFDGTFMLVHHVKDAENYDFLALEDGVARLGRVRQGQKSVLDESPFDAAEWLSVRLVSDRTHFRGYIGGELVVHGHGEAAPPGPVGLRIDGTGTARVRRLAAVSLR